MFQIRRKRTDLVIIQLITIITILPFHHHTPLHTRVIIQIDTIHQEWPQVITTISIITKTRLKVRKKVFHWLLKTNTTFIPRSYYSSQFLPTNFCQQFNERVKLFRLLKWLTRALQSFSCPSVCRQIDCLHSLDFYRNCFSGLKWSKLFQVR